MISSGCARHRSVYVCITVKGSRVCGHCNVLAVRKYVRASMVSGYSFSFYPVVINLLRLVAQLKFSY